MCVIQYENHCNCYTKHAFRYLGSIKILFVIYVFTFNDFALKFMNLVVPSPCEKIIIKLRC